MYETILWAHDAGELADEARPHVLALAQAFKATVLICHVVEVTEWVGGGDAERATGLAYSARIEAAAAGLREAGLPNVETQVLQGVPSKAIVALAQDRDVGMIVMSTHGRGILARAVMGSVSEAVARNTPGIPVLIVHPDDQ